MTLREAMTILADLQPQLDLSALPTESDSYVTRAEVEEAFALILKEADQHDRRCIRG